MVLCSCVPFVPQDAHHGNIPSTSYIAKNGKKASTAELDVAETVCAHTCIIAPLLSRFGCDAEQRQPNDGYEDTAVLRPCDDVLLRGVRRDRPFQRGQAHDGRGFQQHVAHSRHGRIRVSLRPGTTLNHPVVFTTWASFDNTDNSPQ